MRVFLLSRKIGISYKVKNPGILKYPGTEIIKIKSAVPPALNLALRLVLRLRPALVKCCV